jgi:transposase-like protein
VTPEIEPCPYCRATSGVQSTPAPPRVQAWSCTACRTDWAITVVTPRPYFNRLAATVEQLGATRSVLRQVISLADDTATLSDSELRDRLLALADRARLAQCPIVADPGGVTLPR